MLELSGMNNFVGDASDSEGTPFGVQNTGDMDSCDDHYLGLSRSISSCGLVVNLSVQKVMKN